ncbi:oxysterol-binding protein [Plakobranchus ocellatus]|uniref:Oxysterol-binding protein n=1 Tax=Plakobranchus ocellatus TaxID=259542 RepID=A0AAV3ZVB4_9GAST|nr:oxysterol-binding protein [Plakobranchus ocellatus]
MRLRHHRLFRQHELLYGANNDIPRLAEVTSPVEDRPALATANLPELALSQPLKRDTLRQSSFKGSQGRVASWLLDSAIMEQTGKSLHQCQNELSDLRDLLEKIQSLPITPDSGLEVAESSECDNVVLLQRMDSSESDVVVRKKRVFRPYKRRERKSDSYAGTAFSGTSSNSKENSHSAPTSERLTSTSTNASTVSTGSSSSNTLQSPPSDRLKASASNPNLLHYHNSNNSNINSHNDTHRDLSGSSSNISGNGGSGGSGGGGGGDRSQTVSWTADTVSRLAPHEFRIQEIKLRENFLSSAESSKGS